MAQTKPTVQRKPREDLQTAYPVILIGAALAFFFSQGLPLWNDDYSQWIAQAQGGFLTLIARILLPITWEPENWGYSDRPVELLIYKVLHGVFGSWGTGYFFVKSLGFGLLCWMLQRWMRKLGVSRAISWLTLGIFALCANTIASLIWCSDFGIFSQLILAFVLLESVTELRGLTPSSARFNRVFWGFFCLVYFGAKIKGDVRLAPLILVAHLAIYDRKRLRELWPWLTGTFLATLPWSLMMFKHLPPFLGGAGYSGWTYGKFSVARAYQFFATGTLNLRAVPTSLLGAVGILSVLLVLASAVHRFSQNRLQWPGKETGLLWVWLGFSVLALGMVSPQNPTFELRYVLVPLVPAILLLSYAFETVSRDFAKLPDFRGFGFKEAVLAILAVQCGLQLSHAFRYRIDMGRTMVGIDGVYALVEARHPDAQFVLGPGFLNYGYRESLTPALRNRVAVADVNELSRFPTQTTYVASWASSLDARFAVEDHASGCMASVFDGLTGCNPTDGAFLLKYVGSVLELAQADALDKRGDLRGARQILETYWNREPGNHGAAFILGLADYRLGDFSAMEKVYDSFAPYFPNHASVVYNWALAKMGLQKLADASGLLERAFSLAPGDYGIGFNLADTYYKLGKRSRALATVNELLRVFPQNEALSRAKQQYSLDSGKRL